MSASLAVFVAFDTGTMAYTQPIGVAMDAMALVSAGFFFDYVYTSVSPRGPSIWPYTVAIAYLIATAVIGERMMGPAEFAPIVFANIAISILALATYLRSRKTLPPGWMRRPELMRLPVLLAGAGAFHLAQVLRLIAPDEPFLFDLVPFVGAIGLLAFGVYGLIGSQTLRTLASVRQNVAADEQLGPKLDETMARKRIFLDPDLSLQKAAALLGVAPAQLSSHLNSERGLTFRAYVNGQRIDEAKRLLLSPVEARTSIEAVAMMSGFRSRSSFYSAFQSQVGKSPQAFRSSN